MDDAHSEAWLMRIEGALSAHFKQPEGPSRPGTDWKVGLKRGDEVHVVFVRSYLSADASSATRSDTTYQGQTVLGYVSDLLNGGWLPTDPVPSTIVIRNPTGDTAAVATSTKKSWWRIW